MSGKFGNFVEMIRISLLPSYAARVSRDYWKAQERSHIERSVREWEQFLADIDERLALLPDDTVLDYGCGNGEIAQHLLQKGFKVSGCDISEKLLAQARERGVNCSQVSEIINGNREFTKVYMHGVFMYIHPRVRQSFLRQMYDLLEPGGTLFLLAEPDLDKRDHADIHALQKVLAPVFPVYAIFNAGFWTNARSLIRTAQSAGFSNVDVLESSSYRSDFVLSRAE